MGTSVLPRIRRWPADNQSHDPDSQPGKQEAHCFWHAPRKATKKQISKSFSSCQWLLVFWGRTTLKNPWGSTDEDRARAWWSPTGLAAYFAYLSSISNPKTGKNHWWSRRSRQGKESWNTADLSDLKRTMSWTSVFYHCTKPEQMKGKGRELCTSRTGNTALQLLPPEENTFRPAAQRTGHLRLLNLLPQKPWL